LSRVQGEEGKGKGFYVAKLTVGEESTDRVLVFVDSEGGSLGGLVRFVFFAFSSTFDFPLLGILLSPFLFLNFLFWAFGG